MKAIVGLGNPGFRYVNTRHNVGFMVINYISERYNTKYQSNLSSHIASLNINDEKVLLVKPQTYMNDSGVSLLKVVNYYNLDLSDILVIYDDIDIELGKIRIRKKGSAGTHNGMKSVIDHIKSSDIPRLRIGIGSPERIPLVNYVLQRFTQEEMSLIQDVIVKSAEASLSFVKEGIDICMNKYNMNSMS